MWETWDQSLGWEDPLEKGKATHSSILAQRIPWTIQSIGSQRVRHDWATFTLLHFPVLALKALCPRNTLGHRYTAILPKAALRVWILWSTNQRKMASCLNAKFPEWKALFVLSEICRDNLVGTRGIRDLLKVTQFRSSGVQLNFDFQFWVKAVFIPSFYLCLPTEDMSFPGGSDGKESACNVRDPGSVPGLGWSPGVGNDNSLQYSCLENPTDRGAWRDKSSDSAESETTEQLTHTHGEYKLSFNWWRQLDIEA